MAEAWKTPAVTLVFGIFYSLAIGVGDFVGGHTSRRVAPFTVVISFLFFGAIASSLLLLVVPNELLVRGGVVISGVSPTGVG